MIQGMRTVVYPTPDLAAGKAWYSQALQREPYFDEPFYVGFEVGGFELGLIPDGVPGSPGCTAFWGTANVAEELERLVAIGGTLHEAAKDVGEGIIVGTVLDPFGNVLGVIQNPQFDLNKVR